LFCLADIGGPERKRASISLRPATTNGSELTSTPSPLRLVLLGRLDTGRGYGCKCLLVVINRVRDIHVWPKHRGSFIIIYTLP